LVSDVHQNKSKKAQRSKTTKKERKEKEDQLKIEKSKGK